MDLIVQSPIAPMREFSSKQSKIVSEALFSEKVTILKEERDWRLIQTPDSYSGWVQKKHLIETNHETHLETTSLCSHLYQTPCIKTGPLLSLPFGSKLHKIQQICPRWIQVLLPNGKKAFIQSGDTAFPETDWIALSQRFLGLPYTWGGRSSFGFDCSGFVQMLYWRKKIMLPRDAWMQREDPRGSDIPLEAIEPSDLLFFGASSENISHVGFVLKDKTFIHTSIKENKPYLRISSLDDTEWSGQPPSPYLYRCARRWPLCT